MLQVLADEPRAPVEQEQDEDLGHTPALAHHRRGCNLFHPSVGSGR